MIHVNPQTYSRFPRSTDFSTKRTKGHSPTPTKVPPERPEPPASPKNRNRRKAQSDEFSGSRRMLGDLVVRLNAKLTDRDHRVDFQLNSETKRPHIVMTEPENDEVLGKFHSDEVLELERSLHDLAGFRLSITA
ncbi:Flagellar protein FlaG [Sulfidibacter corallicola]|uniref:Flagellar protein FlaG n=1 Tax=Sulfidibacter corallicola TaxID=2818388 RepID=A0A8A4TT92_SULCO|nr:flagellar protein FlaG [Sulfidibacter corallicola]QTD53179.1 flagellar protein FlaG [Sulfidibacter corallicola]